MELEQFRKMKNCEYGSLLKKKFDFRPKIARNYLNKKRTVTDTAIILVP